MLLTRWNDSEKQERLADRVATAACNNCHKDADETDEAYYKRLLEVYTDCYETVHHKIAEYHPKS